MKKVFVLMLAVLLLGTVGMAKVEIFESITIEIGATFAGATIADLGTVTTADINAGTWQGTIDGAWTATGQTCTDLGSISTVDINGGTINGITDLAVADGGTGSSNASDARTALGLIIGTDVQAYDDELTDIAGLTFADDYFILGTGAGTIGTASCTVFAQSILDDADAGTVLGTLGAVIGTNVQAYNANLDDIAGLTFADDYFILGTGAGTIGTASCTSFAQTILDDAAAGNVATTIGLGTGDSPTFTGLTLSGKAVQGGEWGATPVDLDGTDPDQAAQFHADITTDVAGGAYATVYKTMTITSAQTGDTSVFGDWQELYIDGDITIAVGNHAASWGHLELIDGGGTNLTLNSSVTELWSAGVTGSIIVPDALIIGQDRQIASVIATSDITTGYSLAHADSLLAGVLIRADGQPFPVGLLIDDDDATIDIQLSTDQLIDGSTAGVASVAGDSAVEYVAGLMRTVITVDSTSAGDDIDLEDKDDGGGTLLYTFPVGHIRILGCVADLTTTSSAEIFQATFPMSIGTTAAADSEATLTGTEADLCASTAISYDGEVACDLPPVSAADMTYDGTSSAVVAYLNAAVAAADINGAATVKSTGTVTIHWMLLGDY